MAEKTNKETDQFREPTQSKAPSLFQDENDLAESLKDLEDYESFLNTDNLFQNPEGGRLIVEKHEIYEDADKAKKHDWIGKKASLNKFAHSFGLENLNNKTPGILGTPGTKFQTSNGANYEMGRNNVAMRDGKTQGHRTVFLHPNVAKHLNEATKINGNRSVSFTPEGHLQYTGINPHTKTSGTFQLPIGGNHAVNPQYGYRPVSFHGLSPDSGGQYSIAYGTPITSINGKTSPNNPNPVNGRGMAQMLKDEANGRNYRRNASIDTNCGCSPQNGACPKHKAQAQAGSQAAKALDHYTENQLEGMTKKKAADIRKPINPEEWHKNQMSQWSAPGYAKMLHQWNQHQYCDPAECPQSTRDKKTTQAAQEQPFIHEEKIKNLEPKLLDEILKDWSAWEAYMGISSHNPVKVKDEIEAENPMDTEGRIKHEASQCEPVITYPTWASLGKESNGEPFKVQCNCGWKGSHPEVRQLEKQIEHHMYPHGHRHGNEY